MRRLEFSIKDFSVSKYTRAETAYGPSLKTGPYYDFRIKRGDMVFWLEPLTEKELEDFIFNLQQMKEAKL